MSKMNGDKSRHGRIRKQGIARRERMRVLRQTMADAKVAAAAAAAIPVAV